MFLEKSVFGCFFTIWMKVYLTGSLGTPIGSEDHVREKMNL